MPGISASPVRLGQLATAPPIPSLPLSAGVVADSVPELEWRETEHKARALLRASELVEEGLE